jgi:threonine dehydrogenase-like Zn-dependent dehydrogenase
MRALILTDKLTFDPNHPQPVPLPGEAVIRVTRAGICNTDLELVKGYMGFRGVLGHEFVGVVEQMTDDGRRTTADQSSVVGGPSSIRPGDRVVGEINAVAPESPSRDYFARAQDPARTTLGIDRRDGVFADYTRLPLANLHRVPDSVSDDEAVFVEPLAAACQVLEQVHIHSTHRVAVLGDGKLGLLCAQVLATTGCELIAFGKHANKLDILRQRGIKTSGVSSGSTMTGEHAETPEVWSRDFDVIVECTGAAGGFDMARRMLRPRGTLVLKSTFEGLTTANLTAIVVDEISVVGSRCGPFAPALRLLEQKRVDVLSLVHAHYTLDEGLRAFEHARSHGVLKVLLDL